MSLESGALVSDAVNTPRSIFDLTGLDTPFHWGEFTLDASATGACYIGGLAASSTSKHGTPLAEMVPYKLVSTGAPGPYHTKSTYFSFAVAAATEVVSFNLLLP